MSVARIENELGSGELTEQMAYYKLEPWGPERDNWHIGILASMYANRYKKQGTPAIQATDFLWGAKDKTVEKQTSATLAALDALAMKNGSNKT